MRKRFLFITHGVVALVAAVALTAVPAVSQPLSHPSMQRDSIGQRAQTTRPVQTRSAAPAARARVQSGPTATTTTKNSCPSAYYNTQYGFPAYPGPNAPLPPQGSYYYPNPYYGYGPGGYYNNGYYNNGYYNNGYHNGGTQNYSPGTRTGTSFPAFQGY